MTSTWFWCCHLDFDLSWPIKNTLIFVSSKSECLPGALNKTMMGLSWTILTEFSCDSFLESSPKWIIIDIYSVWVFFVVFLVILCSHYLGNLISVISPSLSYPLRPAFFGLTGVELLLTLLRIETISIYQFSHQHANCTQKGHSRDSKWQPPCCKAAMQTISPPCSPFRSLSCVTLLRAFLINAEGHTVWCLEKEKLNWFQSDLIHLF